MQSCCCSLAGTSACNTCRNRPSSEWLKPVYVINPPFTVDTTNFPPQEFVPIVRCKDCERVRFDYHDEQYPCFCDKWLQGVKYDDYCSYGERKEE